MVALNFQRSLFVTTWLFSEEVDEMTNSLSAIGGLLSLIALMTVVLVAGSANSDPAHWPQWRGPFFNGVAKGSAPVEFSDTKNIKWKVGIPGRGFSTPVIWGDRIFLTTAAPTGKGAQPASPEQGVIARTRRRWENYSSSLVVYVALDEG
jgi:hypothetical protein